MAMPRVAVVGGSIAGLTAAALLRDAGCEVDVYERSTHALSGFGAGIVIQPELVRYFLERTAITLDEISVPSSAIRYFNAATGAPVGEIAADWRYTSYNSLYRGLLESFGTARYHLDHSLSKISPDGHLEFKNGKSVHCDLAVCADGSFSTARELLLGVAPKYAGYVTWRGIAPHAALSPETWAFFNDRFTYGLLPDGHLIAYPIPGDQINFQWYWNVPEGRELDTLMTDRDGVRRPVSVHFDVLPPARLSSLYSRAKEKIGLAPFVELIHAADKPFVTVIADTDVPRMAIGRVCLIGDAAVTGRPHAAAGAAKAAANGWGLAEALLEARGDVPAALAAWEPAQLRQGRALLAKVRHMGGLLQHGGAFLPGDPACRFGLPPC